jgi:hypothetical protein
MIRTAFDAAHLFHIAEPYHVNVLFTAARIVPHTTAVRFMGFILEHYPDSHRLIDRVIINIVCPTID